MNRMLLLALALFASMPLQASQPNVACGYAVKSDLAALEAALEEFHHDIGRYPTTQERLSVLVEPTPDIKASGKYPRGAYLERVPSDPWGYDYHYGAPGIRGGQGYDLWSNGADGQQGGQGINADVGNWPGSVDSYIAAIKPTAWTAAMGSLLIAAVLSLPVLPVAYLRRKHQATAGARFKFSLTSFGRSVLILALLAWLASGILDKIS